MAEIIRANGTSEEVEPKNGKYFTCDEIEAYLGDTYQYLDAGNDGALFIDDAGKLKELPTNIRGTLLFRNLGGDPEDYIAGDMVVLTRSEVVELEEHID